MAGPSEELFNDGAGHLNQSENLASDEESEGEQQQVVLSEIDDSESGGEEDEEGDEEFEEDEDEDDVQPQHKVRRFKKSKKLKIANFIDDEAELSGDDEVSEDEADSSDDDQLDPELVDQDAKDLGSDEEEEVRRLYHKQLETDDRRQLLLLQEHLEDNEIAAGQRRRRKFRWQTKELMENSLKRHYDPDDDDSLDDEEDDVDYSDLNPRLRRPVGSSLLIGSALITSNSIRPIEPGDDQSQSDSQFSAPRTYSKAKSTEAGPSLLSDDSNSNTTNSRLASSSLRKKGPADMNRYLYRDKEIVEALSTRETVIATREEKDRVIQREMKRVLQSKSVFDQLYS